MATEHRTAPAFCRAIYTKYVGPTDTKGARILCLEPIGKVRKFYPFHHEASDAHEHAARKFCEHLDASQDPGYRKRDWSRATCGESADGRGYVFLVPLAAEGGAS